MGKSKLFKCEAWITQYFGYTDFAKRNYKSGYHEGLDLVPVDRESWEIYAPCDGRIMYSGWGNVYGWNVMLWNQPCGMMLRFCHLEKKGVGKGQIIKAGDYIGTTGSTGNSTARHLHLNAVPMSQWGRIDFAHNGTGGRVDPLGVLRVLGVNV